jgi:hypothetical protein
MFQHDVRERATNVGGQLELRLTHQSRSSIVAARDEGADHNRWHRVGVLTQAPPNQCQAIDDASRAVISGTSLIPVNSFIFGMIYCKRPAKDASKEMANG